MKGEEWTEERGLTGGAEMHAFRGTFFLVDDARRMEVQWALCQTD